MNNELVVTLHAWEQYCLRVEPIDRDTLTEMLNDHIEDQHIHKRDLVLIGDVWWVYIDHKIISCYGKSHLDLPAAIGWAMRNNDRIVLDHDA